jgi:hypothetical protein
MAGNFANSLRHIINIRFRIKLTVTVHGYFDIIEQRTQCQNSRFQLGIL